MFAERQLRRDRLLSAGLALLVIGLCAAIYLAWNSRHRLSSDIVEEPAVTSGTDAISPVPRSPEDFGHVWEGRDPDRAATETSPNDRMLVGTSSSDALGFKLRGTVYSTIGESVAFIEYGGTPGVYGVGDIIEGWRLSAIGMSSVTVTRDGQERTLGLQYRPFSGRQPSALASRASTTEQVPKPTLSGPSRSADAGARKGSSRGAPSRRSDPVSRSSRQVSRPTRPTGADATVAVAPELVEKLRQDPKSVRFGVDFSPLVDKRGTMRGISVDGVASGSLGARYGLAPGDRILAVNGHPISSPASAMQLYQRYRNSNSVSVTLLRGGTQRNVVFYAR